MDLKSTYRDLFNDKYPADTSSTFVKNIDGLDVNTHGNIGPDTRSTSLRLFDKVAEQPIAQLMQKASTIPIAGWVLPDQEQLRILVDDRVNWRDKGGGALEAVGLAPVGVIAKWFKKLGNVNAGLHKSAKLPLSKLHSYGKPLKTDKATSIYGLDNVKTKGKLRKNIQKILANYNFKSKDLIGLSYGTSTIVDGAERGIVSFITPIVNKSLNGAVLDNRLLLGQPVGTYRSFADSGKWGTIAVDKPAAAVFDMYHNIGDGWKGTVIHETGHIPQHYGSSRLDIYPDFSVFRDVDDVVARNGQIGEATAEAMRYVATGRIAPHSFVSDFNSFSDRIKKFANNNRSMFDRVKIAYLDTSNPTKESMKKYVDIINNKGVK